MAAFERLCHQLEVHDECQFTMADLVAMMPSEDSYSERYLAQLLKDKYKDRVIIVERPGRSPILCFLGENFDQIGNVWYKNRSTDLQEERRRIVQKAAEIIRSDIFTMVHEPEFFPDLSGSNQNFAPDSLMSFLNTVTLPRKQRESSERRNRICDVLAHSIICTARPHVISPIQLGLGIWVHRKLGSKTLCDILYRMGSCVHYSVIQEYEKSAVIHSRLDFDSDAYIQLVFDNFDFNTATVDGHGTVHSMGGMIFVTPSTGVPPPSQLPRLTSETKKISLSQFGSIPLQIYRKPVQNGLSQITAADLRPEVSLLSTSQAESVSTARQLDLLWLIGNTGMPRIIPGWSG
ncbi:Putative F-box protein [Frankliniella fusca]|uniref:F-box protein n=1 Tax=Frankliniella fusca TaxID=407009 RepID=A0AAE1HAG8_9NEOP|nr:Putative F-box protein [Frankliniella fusca]